MEFEGVAGTVAYGCEVLFGEGDERATAMQELIEGATGQPCPCKQDRSCPLIPRLVVEQPEVKKVA